MADTKSTDEMNKGEAENVETQAQAGNAATEASKLTGKLLQNPEVMAAFEQKLASMVGRRSSYIDSLPHAVKRRLKALKRLQFEYHNLESKFYEELHKLEIKYAELQKPLLAKRHDIVNAVTEPTDSDCDWSSDEEDEDKETEKKTAIESGEKTEEEKTEKEESPKSEFDENTKGIPEFWLTIFKNVDLLSEIMQDHDEQVIKSLQDVRVKLISDGSMGFILEFVFAPNEYFENTVLTKEYIMRSGPNPKDPLSYEGPQIVKCTGCKIDWKKGKNITVKNIKQKQKGKSGAKKMVTKAVKCDSFFNFFSPPQGQIDDDAVEEDEETQSLLLQDFEVGQMLQQLVIPKAVLYFTGDALDNNDEDEYEYGEEGEGEDYDEDNDPDYKPKEGKEPPGECKQQ